MLVDTVRKTCTAGDNTPFIFRTTSIAFVVKNFTTEPIYVCLGTWSEQQSVMIAAGMWECIRSNPDPAACMTRSATATVLVRAQTAGIVEVRRYD